MPLGLYFVAIMVNHLVLPPRLLWERSQMVVTPVHGNRRSLIYHLPDCPNYNSMLEENKVYFRSAAEAEKDCNNEYAERFHGGISSNLRNKVSAHALGRGRLEIVGRASLFRDEAPDVDAYSNELLAPAFAMR